MPRPEQDRERCEQESHPERRILLHRHRRALGGQYDVRVLGKDGVAVGDGLELQRDVGENADHRDDGDEPGQKRALAVAGRNKVGKRRDAVRLADADDLPDHQPPQRHHQRRSDIDRQEAHTVPGGAADASVERPCRGVHAQRQCVDVWIGDDRAATVGPVIAVVGNGEQHAEVSQRDGDDHPALEHGSPARFRRRD